MSTRPIGERQFVSPAPTWNACCRLSAVQNHNARLNWRAERARDRHRDSLAGLDDGAVDTPWRKRAVCLLPCSLKKPKNQRCAVKGLFSFMAAFGRHRDQGACKQGDSRTFLWRRGFGFDLPAL